MGPGTQVIAGAENATHVLNYLQIRDSFERQVTEAVRIERPLQAGLLMSKDSKEIEVKSLNRKFEHFCPRVRPENLEAGGGQ